MPDPVDAHQLMTTLTGQLDILNDVLPACASESLVHPIDYYEAYKAPTLIETGMIRGTDALTTAMAAYRNLSKARSQFPGSVLRTPGLIIVDKPLGAMVSRINDQKDAIRDYVHQLYPNPQSRNRFTRKNFPGRVMLQVYRHIHYLEEIQKLTFTWVPASHSSTKIDRHKALALLEHRDSQGIDHLKENNLIALRKAIDDVRSSPTSAEYKIRKPRPPYPVANIHLPNGDIPQLNVSLPIIIYNTDGPPIITELPDYNPETKRKTRKDKHDHILLFKPLYLYQKK